MKVYIVARGCYSDYHVVAVCSTMDKAQEAKRVLLADDPVEWELDAIPEHPPGHWPYSVWMDAEGNSKVYETIGGSMTEPQPHGDGERMAFRVWATDPDHAVKIANEQRVQLITGGQWETDWSVWKSKHP